MKKIGATLLKINKLELQEKERLNNELCFGFTKVDDSEFDALRKIIAQ